jgi:hypothetical protein
MLSSIFTDLQDACWFRDKLNRYCKENEYYFVVVDRKGLHDVLTIGTALKLDFPIYVKE